MSCIYCKVIKGELPTTKVYEDDNFIGILDIRPLNPGHTLLIPKEHVEWVNDYEPYCNYWETARKISRAIQSGLNPILVSYVVYGLGVPHAHIHMIPKFEGDQHPHGPNPEKTIEYKDGEAEKVASLIKKAL